MGVQLSDLISAKPIEFDSMRGKRVAIDAMNSLYQFLSSIRQPTGEPLEDSAGRITSHLSGLLYRNVNLISYGIQPVYVFDGKPAELKTAVVERRKEARERAAEKWQRALARGEIEEARIHAQQSSRFSKEMLDDSKMLLEYMGIPWVQAPSEGEAQAAYMVIKGDVWAAGSQDYDSLLFGSTRLVRNLAISGKRKLPRKELYIDIKPEIIHLEEALKELGLSREQLVELSILIGTDYNPKGVEGIGPKKAYELIKEFGSVEKALEKKSIKYGFDVEEIKQLFLRYETFDDYRLEWKNPDKEKVVGFLCDEHDFSVERVTNALKRVEEVMPQSSLDSWF